MNKSITKQNILIILPPSIAGTLIMKGFSSGFEALGHEVLTRDYRELDKNDIEKFNPTIILGYDFSYLIDKKLTQIIQKMPAQKCFYFADEPKSSYAMYTDEIYSKFCDIKDKYVFIWDKNISKEFENAKYLPLAVDITAYSGEDFEKDYDITFVGRPLTQKRQKVLACLIKNFGEKLKIFSFEKHFEKSIEEIREQKLLNTEELETYKKSFGGFLKCEKDLAKVYKKSKINLNITLQGESSLNYRVFEVMAAGGFLLTDNVSDNELFIAKEHFDIYESENELINKIKYYLEYDARACSIAENARKYVKQHHTFAIRAKELLALV